MSITLETYAELVHLPGSGESLKILMQNETLKILIFSFLNFVV